MQDLKTYLAHHPLVFDGGMGTYYKAAPGFACEQANTADPDGVLAVHRAYLEAGAQALKTNTFGLTAMAAGRSRGGRRWQMQGMPWRSRLRRTKPMCLPTWGRCRIPKNGPPGRSIQR